MMQAYRLDYSGHPATLVKFVLRGDTLQPAAISDDLGVSPDRAWAKGERLHETSVRLTETWTLNSGGSRDQNFAAQLSLLLDRLESLPTARSKFIATYTGAIEVAHAADYAQLGGFHIDQATMRRLCRLGVAIDFDLYPVDPVSASGSPDTF